ncbi:outer membrane family protein [Helicobacter suis]|uniref:outer membrane family protein n=1 Tax=Helicobacter suis TaxID=104628 RepID=UPI0013D372C3|nr:outer membrane family protein [Helicobacter suis]
MQNSPFSSVATRFVLLAFIFLGSFYFFAPSLKAFDYKIGAKAVQTSQVGFNQAPMNRNKGIYPMQQYGTVSGFLNVDFNLLPKKLNSHSLKVGIGGMAGGVFFDSTRKLHGGSKIYDYYGFYDGYLGGASNILSDDDIVTANGKERSLAKTYIFSDAFIEYKYKDFFGIKGGRYTSTMPYRSGKTQGFEVFGEYKHTRLIWFSSFGRAIAGGGFLINWYAPRTSYSGNWSKNAQGGWTHHGYQLSYGTHALRLIYNKHKLLTEFFYYFSPKMFNAPGFSVIWDSDPNFSGKGFRSQSKLIAFFPLYEPWMVVNSSGAPIYKYDRPVSAHGQSLILSQRFEYNNFYLVGTFYKNFGNANAYVGNMGNPAGVLMGGNSMYAGGWGSAIKGDSVTGYLAYGGTHFKKKFTWKMQWQWTSAPVSYEGRYMLTLEYVFNQYIRAAIDLTYYGVHTNKGYQAGLSKFCNPTVTYCGGGYQDRSAFYNNLIVSF